LRGLRSRKRSGRQGCLPALLSRVSDRKYQPEDPQSPCACPQVGQCPCIRAKMTVCQGDLQCERSQGHRTSRDEATSHGASHKTRSGYRQGYAVHPTLRQGMLSFLLTERASGHTQSLQGRHGSQASRPAAAGFVSRGAPKPPFRPDGSWLRGPE